MTIGICIALILLAVALGLAREASRPDTSTVGIKCPVCGSGDISRAPDKVACNDCAWILKRGGHRKEAKADG
jgi:propanediol utilization protein